MKIIDEADLRGLEDHLGRTLDRVLHEHFPDSTRDSVRDFVLAGGKRTRPQLCVWAFDAVARCPGRPTALLDVACAWELFHAFLLVHDDIIDSSNTRRDQPSLHRRLALLHGDSKGIGEACAIVCGDLLFTAALDVIHQVELPTAALRRVLRLFTHVAGTTGAGQVDDIVTSHMPPGGVTESAVLEGYRRKTAGYTFGGPMVSGAIIAGADARLAQAIERFANYIGQAYQLHNDLLDLDQPAHPGCDLMEGKRTVTLLRAVRGMPPAMRAAFEADLLSLASPRGNAMVTAESLRQRIRATSAIDQTMGLIDELLTDARETTARMPAPTARRFRLLLDSLRHSYFATTLPQPADDPAAPREACCPTIVDPCTLTFGAAQSAHLQ